MREKLGSWDARRQKSLEARRPGGWKAHKLESKTAGRLER
jgi:hypothetical protein